MPCSLMTPPHGAIIGDFPTDAPPFEITWYRCWSLSDAMNTWSLWFAGFGFKVPATGPSP